MRSKTASLAGVLGVGLAFALTAGAAGGESTPALNFELGLTSQQPASATALSLHTVYKNPSDPNAKPSPLRKSAIEAPAGTVFDGQAIPACRVSDDQLLANGPSACPAGSQVGSGTVSLITGFGPPVDPFMIDAALFNGGTGIIELFSEHRSGQRISVGHATFTAPNTLTETPAPEPGGPPDGQSAVHEVNFHFNQLRGPNGQAFITTPPACPAGGVWTSTITATVADGHTYTATSTTPCTTTPGSTPSPGSATSPKGACASNRTFTVHVKRRYRTRVLSATILISGHRLARLKPGQLSLRINLLPVSVK